MKKVKLIVGFILIIFLFVILFLSFKSFWPAEWPEAAQATLGAAITAGVISILGIYLKFVFDQISSETEYDKKVSGSMMSKLHTYAEEYYIPLMTYAGSSASQLDMILTNNAKASTQEKQLALFFIAKYFKYGLKLTIEKGGLIFLQDFDSESCLEQLNASARRNLKLTTDQISRLQKSIALEDTPLDFSMKIQADIELAKIYTTFEKWFKQNNDVKKTIVYFHCYNEFLRHELNLIYMPWYRRKAPQMSHGCNKIIKICKKLEKLDNNRADEKISKKNYEEKKEKEKENLNKSILELFE